MNAQRKNKEYWEGVVVGKDGEIETLNEEIQMPKEEVDSLWAKEFADVLAEAGAGYKKDRERWLNATVVTAVFALWFSLAYFWYSVEYGFSWGSELSILTVFGVLVSTLYFYWW